MSRQNKIKKEKKQNCKTFPKGMDISNVIDKRIGIHTEENQLKTKRKT